MNGNDLNSILNDIDVALSPGMYFDFTWGEDDKFLQVKHPDIGSGRKWRLSEFMTKSEVVQTAFMAYLTWVEHEARESFTYKGQAIFSPHYDVEALVELSAAGKHDVR